jgi:hypothetical protein
MLRSRTKYDYSQVGTDDESDDTFSIDFQNAVLYVGAFQVVLATVLCAITSLMCCWLLPSTAVSAVRTLVLSSLVPALLVRRPFRIGRVHGLSVVFGALRPCCAIYVASLISEQLVHTCTRDLATPSWRRLVFHALITVCLISGFARARKPLEETDAPFLATVISLFFISMLPPPAVLLSGPLCSNPSLTSAAERLVRAFTFSSLYCIFVYTSAPPIQSNGEILLCVMRAGAASVWCLGCHAILLPLAVLQSALVIYTRIYNTSDHLGMHEMQQLIPSQQSHSPPNSPIALSLENRSDIEAASPAAAGSPEAARQPSSLPTMRDEASKVALSPTTSALHETSVKECSNGLIIPNFASLGPRAPVDIGGSVQSMSSIAVKGSCGAGGLSSSEFSAIAAKVASEDL